MITLNGSGKEPAHRSIYYGFHASPFGECLIASTGRGLCALTFIGRGGRRGAYSALRKAWKEATLYESPRRTRPLLERAFGANPSRSPELLLKGSAFKLKVWKSLLKIPSGRVVSYQDVAEAIGMPGAVRAVGRAVAGNPIAFIIPCHRVVRKAGDIGGYRWGIARKKAILRYEKRAGLWYVYVLRCRDSSLYVGSTTDIRRRLGEHAAGKGSAYTRSRRPVKMLYQENHPSRRAAQRREAWIKGRTRAAKLALIGRHNRLRKLAGQTRPLGI